MPSTGVDSQNHPQAPTEEFGQAHFTEDPLVPTVHPPMEEGRNSQFDFFATAISNLEGIRQDTQQTQQEGTRSERNQSNIESTL